MTQQLLGKGDELLPSEEAAVRASTSQVFIVTPAYNEADNLPRMLGEVSEVLTDHQEKFRILVVNDGSQDATAEVVEQLAQTLPVGVLHHAQNLGAGAAFQTGLSAACSQAQPQDVIIILEADGTNDPRIIPQMLKCIRAGNDIVIGSRYRFGGGYRKFPLCRLGLSLGANFLMRRLFPIPSVRDYTIFCRAYRADFLRRGFEWYENRLIERRSFACNAEILIKLRVFKPSVSEVPMLYRYDLKQGRSKLPAWQTIQEYFAFIFEMWKAKGEAAGQSCESMPK